MFLARIATITRGSSPSWPPWLAPLLPPVPGPAASGAEVEGSEPGASVSGSAEHWRVDVRRRRRRRVVAQTEKRVRTRGVRETVAMARRGEKVCRQLTFPGSYLKEISQEEVFVCFDISASLFPPALLLHNEQKEEVPEIN